MNFGKKIADAIAGMGGKWKGVATAISGMTKVQMAIAGTVTIVTIGGIGVGGYFLHEHFKEPEVLAEVVMDTEAEIAGDTEQTGAAEESVLETEATEAVEETETEEEETVEVTLVGSSIEKDLKIKIQNEKSQNIKGQPFEITVALDEKNAKAVTYSDHDQDGIIYIKDIEPGDYIVTLKEIEGFNCEENSIKVTVKAEIEYVKVDVTDEIKDESEVDASEDAKVDNVAVEGVISDTVALIDSTCESQKVTGAEVDMTNFTKAAVSGTSTATITQATVTASRYSTGYHASTQTEGTPSTQSTDGTEGGSEGSTTTDGTEGGSEGGSGDGTTTETVTYTITHEFYEADGSTPSGKSDDTKFVTIPKKETSISLNGIEYDGYTADSLTINNVSPDKLTYTIRWRKNAPTVYSYTINHYFDGKLDSSKTQTGTAEAGTGIDAASYKNSGYTTTGATSLTVTNSVDKNVLNVYWTKVASASTATVSIPQTATLYNCPAEASKSITLATTIEDKDSIIEKIEWTSSDSKIVTVTDGSIKGCKITAIANGTAQITATITYKNPADTTKTKTSVSCTVTVKNLSDTNVNLKDSSGRALYKDNECKALATLADYKVDGVYYTAPQYTGWQTINGKVYYYGADHKPVTGTQVISGISYNFGSDGAIVKGSGRNGIDVSSHQGVIDWEAVKAAGIDFAIIRVGYRGSKTGALVEDSYFKRNIQGATSAGIKVGVYFFTQAVTEAEAVEEASMALSLTSGYNLSYPIFVDTENGSGSARANGLDKATRTACVSAFCKTIQNGGRSAGVYASKSWYNSKIDASAFNSYFIWVAQYNTTCNYTGKYNMWQYSSKGSVPGIKGNVDVNISYVN